MPDSGVLRLRRKRRSRERQAAERAQAEAPAPAGSVCLARVPAMVLLGACTWLLVTLLVDARFRVQELTVSGVEHLSVEQVERVVDVVGRSVFLVPARRLARDLRAEYGCIQSATVRTVLPNEVLVAVEEKDVALVWRSGERYWWLGAMGEVLGEAPDAGNLVVVRDAEGVAPNPARHVVGVPVDLVRGLHTALSTNRSYDYVSDLGLVVYVTSNKWPVYLGHQGDAALKVAILRALVEDLVQRGVQVEYIDLRSERRPTFKPAETAR